MNSEIIISDLKRPLWQTLIAAFLYTLAVLLILNFYSENFNLIPIDNEAGNFYSLLGLIPRGLPR